MEDFKDFELEGIAGDDLYGGDLVYAQGGVFMHQDAKGKRYPLPLMTDTHLKNTIELFLDRLAEARSIVDGSLIESPQRKSDLLLTGVQDEKALEK